MDPITLILSALVAGAASAAKETATEAVKDAYQGLKQLIKNKFVGKADAETALNIYEKKPEVWREPLKDALMEVSADKDEEIIGIAQAILAQSGHDSGSGRIINVNFAGPVHGSVVGDNNQVSNSFGEIEKGK